MDYMYRGDLHRDPLYSEFLHVQRVNEGRDFISVVLTGIVYCLLILYKVYIFVS